MTATAVKRYTTSGAAGTEVGRRAERHMADNGCDYREAMHAVLAADKQLAQAYAQPATRRVRMATTDKRSSSAVPVTGGDEREIKDWITRALEANMAGSLPGALGQLSIEADKFAKIGMPVEEASRRAMDLFPHFVSLAKLLLVDVRRNAPELAPTSEDKPEAGSAAGYAVHAAAVKLQQEHPNLDYREAVGAVLFEDPALKQRYAGVQL